MERTNRLWSHVCSSFHSLFTFTLLLFIWLMEPANFLLPTKCRQAIRSFSLLPVFAAPSTLRLPTPPPLCHFARRWREHLAPALAMKVSTFPLPQPPPLPPNGPEREIKTAETAQVTSTDRAKSYRNQSTRRHTTKPIKINCWRIISGMRGRRERVCKASILARWVQGGQVQGRVWRSVGSRVIRLQRPNRWQMMSQLESPWMETIVISRLATVSALDVPSRSEDRTKRKICYKRKSLSGYLKR